MLKAFSILNRLFRAARVLASYDVLPPREWAPLAPPLLVAAGRVLPRSKAKRNGRSGERMALALTELGPSYIKAGQFLATRPDVIGPEIALDLSKLQDRLPPFPHAEAVAILEQELAPETVQRIGPLGDPVAAASIAQVHKVSIRGAKEGDPARTLALKILRPNVDTELALDLEAFGWMARRIEAFDDEGRRMKPTAVVETLARSVAMEMDLRLEAAAASEMLANSGEDTDIRIPAIEWDFTSRRVLATEWIDGTPLRDREALIALGFDVKQLATKLIQAFLRHALRDGFFHADMHPGNLFVDREGKIVIVDFGIMGRLDKASRRFMAETLSGFLTRDYHHVAEIHFGIGFVPGRHSVDDFAQALRAIGEPIFGRPASNMSMARLLAQLFEVTRLFDMELQPQLVMLQKTMVVVEGVARQLDPDHSIWDSARPVVEKWMIDSVGPQARLQEATEGIGSFGRALASLPEAVRNARDIANALTTTGVRLHPDSTRSIEAGNRSNRLFAQIALAVSLLAAALVVATVFH
jgi:ubiquinone biosynthesis protein